LLHLLNYHSSFHSPLGPLSFAFDPNLFCVHPQRTRIPFFLLNYFTILYNYLSCSWFIYTQEKMTTAEDPLVASWLSTSSGCSDDTLKKSLTPLPPDVVQKKTSEYKPKYKNDCTKEILQSFLDHLPAQGKVELELFIADTNCNDDILFQLASHLYSAILLPSKLDYLGNNRIGNFQC